MTPPLSLNPLAAHVGFLCYSRVQCKYTVYYMVFYILLIIAQTPPHGWVRKSINNKVLAHSDHTHVVKQMREANGLTEHSANVLNLSVCICELVLVETQDRNTTL